MAVSFIGIAIGFVILTAIGGAMLRAAVSIVNRFLPKNTAALDGNSVDGNSVDNSADGGMGELGDATLRDTSQGGDEQAKRDLSNPFSPPTTESELYLSDSATPAIPEPKFVFACLITFLQVVVASFGNGLVSWVLITIGILPGWISGLLCLALMVMTAAVIFKLMAPTTYLRAVIVTVIQWGMLLCAGLLINGVLFFLLRVS